MESIRQFGRIYTGWLYDGAIERLWARSSPEARSAFGRIERLRAFSREIGADLGHEMAVLEERVVPWPRSAIYNRTVRLSRATEPWWVQWRLDAAGTVQGLLVQPAPTPAPSRFLDYRT
jgi:hypothetical protein